MDFGDLKMGHRGTRLHIIYQKKKILAYAMKYSDQYKQTRQIQSAKSA